MTQISFNEATIRPILGSARIGLFCGYEDDVIIRRDSRESLEPGAGRLANKGANVNVCKEGGDEYRIKGEEVMEEILWRRY